MKVVQTFWSGKKTDILNDPFGWVDAKYHLQSWALSSQLLRRLYDDVELYTDKAGYDLFINKLKLPYTKVHVVLDELNDYPSQVWGLSKIHTYSLQDSPFIHLDGDVFLWKKFSEELISSDFVVQNREVENKYYISSWMLLEKELKFIPEEIKKHRQTEAAVNMYNFGIFGGKNIDFIQQYCRKAFEFVDRNLNHLDRVKGVNFNISFEQYLFYCMVQDHQVARYFKQDIIPDQYTGVANFLDVPGSRSYLHLLADFKKKEYVCRNMSRQLAIEFPEQYQTCLEVLGLQREQKIFNLQCYGNSTQENRSFAQYYQSLPEPEKFRKIKKILKNHLHPSIEKDELTFQSKEALQSIVQEVQDSKVSRSLQHAVHIDDYLKSLDRLDFNEYAQREYQQHKLYLKFQENRDLYSFTSPPEYTILKEPFLLCDEFSQDHEDPSAEISRIIQPSAKNHTSVKMN